MRKHMRSIATLVIKLGSGLLALVLLMSAECPEPSKGGIVIAQNDSTAPSLTLGAGQPGGQGVSVSNGGSGENRKLTSKSGPLNLNATAKDSESGVQALEIWVNKRTTTCEGDICSTTGPGLLGKPMFDSTSPQKKPGETTAESSMMLQSLDLSLMIPQGSPPRGQSRTVDIILDAKAVNHRGGRTQTPTITLTWSEP